MRDLSVPLRTTGELLVACLVCCSATGCSGNAKPRYLFPAPEAPAVGTVVEGIASWYGPGYDGKRASSGEVFDQDALTAAHPYWAFGTKVRVTLLSTGKGVVVRVNDRFPAHKGRAIDLSRAAAKAIGLIGPGTGRVRMEVVAAPAAAPTR
jgi:rare lipoprotein A